MENDRIELDSNLVMVTREILWMCRAKYNRNSATVKSFVRSISRSVPMIHVSNSFDAGTVHVIASEKLNMIHYSGRAKVTAAICLWCDVTEIAAASHTGAEVEAALGSPPITNSYSLNKFF